METISRRKDYIKMSVAPLQGRLPYYSNILSEIEILFSEYVFFTIFFSTAPVRSSIGDHLMRGTVCQISI